VIGDVRGKGLFAGLELVTDRVSRQPVQEEYCMRIVAACLRRGLMIGRTNRSFAEHNNTLCLSPALIATAGDIDDILELLDQALAENPLN
jgi:taurine-pyruvate aminotransferase